MTTATVGGGGIFVIHIALNLTRLTSPRYTTCMHTQYNIEIRANKVNTRMHSLIWAQWKKLSYAMDHCATENTEQCYY